MTSPPERLKKNDTLKHQNDVVICPRSRPISITFFFPGSGKKFFHNVLTGEQFANEEFYVAIITPIIHYCMGGLEITTQSEVYIFSTTDI